MAHIEASQLSSLADTLRRVPCPFARDSRVEVLSSASRNGGADWHTYVGAVAELLERTGAAADVVACPLPVSQEALPDGLLTQAVHTVLAGAVVHSGEPLLTLYSEIETPRWEYRLFGVDYFPLVMAPVYPCSHPRFIQFPRPVLLFQPEASFARRGISSSSQNRARLSSRCERSFERSARDYFGDITRKSPKAHRVIKPLLVQSPPIRWWRSDLSAAVPVSPKGSLPNQVNRRLNAGISL
jgi:hypothetical protein